MATRDTQANTTPDTQAPAVLSASDIPALANISPDPEFKRGIDPYQKVKIKLHMDKKKGKGITVNVNNHRFFIPRNTVVEVPYYIAAVLANSKKQDEETAKMIEEYGEKAEAFDKLLRET